MNAVPALCCIVTRGLSESHGGVFDHAVCPTSAVFEQKRDNRDGK